MSATRLVLVRHGQSAAQVDGTHVGHDHCKGLSELGRQQAAALARRLERGELGSVDVLYSSVMARAVETAQIIGPAIGHPVPTQDCGVCEIHPGEADGLTWPEIEARWPTEAGTGWHPGVQKIDGSETWAEMYERIRASMARLAEAHEGATVVIACHGGVVAHAMRSFLSMPVDEPGTAWTVADNTSITEFVLDAKLADWRKGRWGLVRYNDHAHLADLS